MISRLSYICPSAEGQDVLRASLRDAKQRPNISVAEFGFSPNTTHFADHRLIQPDIATSAHVHCVRHRLHMVGIDAAMNPACVIQLKARGNRSVLPFIEILIGEDSGTLSVHHAVTAFVRRPLPQPALRRLNDDVLRIVARLAMTTTVANGFALNVATFCPGASRKPSRQAAPTHANAGRVWSRPGYARLSFGMGFVRAAPAPWRLGRRFRTTALGTNVARLRLHRSGPFASLLPSVASHAAGGFSLPLVYHFTSVQAKKWLDRLVQP